MSKTMTRELMDVNGFILDVERTVEVEGDRRTETLRFQGGPGSKMMASVWAVGEFCEDDLLPYLDKVKATPAQEAFLAAAGYGAGKSLDVDGEPGAWATLDGVASALKELDRYGDRFTPAVDPLGLDFAIPAPEPRVPPAAPPWRSERKPSLRTARRR